MIEVFFIRNNNEKIKVEVPEGHTLMEAAKLADVPEIPADCVGCCACATCHVYIGNAWVEKLGKIDTDTPEIDLLEYEKGYKDGISRLSCQIYLTKEMNGLTVHLRPEEIL